MISTGKKVFVALSGGVDSSVAALLLKRDGYDITGAHMICWEGCENNQDKQDAMSVAATLSIPFMTFDFRVEYRKRVFDYMVSEYAAGRTPNPDVMCNSEIKFGIFLERALSMGADFIATGHYVRKEAKLQLGSFASKLLVAKDKNKDQSYFLCRLNQKQISKAIFPIGDYLKSEVRELAREAGLVTASKKDSQGLCFVGKVDFQDYIREFLPKHEGMVVNSRGKILGKHDGIEFFTPGQRHGLKIGGQSDPIYIAEKELASNTLVVAQGADDPILYKKEILISDINWISEKPKFPLKCRARIRYRQPLEAAIISEDGRVVFDKPQRGVAPGQFAALYLNEEMMGGGFIIS